VITALVTVIAGALVYCGVVIWWDVSVPDRTYGGECGGGGSSADASKQT
jgi:hypothetical protein